MSEEREEKRRRVSWWRRITGRARSQPEEEDEEHALEEWEDLVEQRIQEAMRRGDFDNLSLKGKPLWVKHNPLVDPAVELAHNLLAGQGFAPGWIEERKSILADINILRERIHRAWHWYMRRLEVLHARDQDDPAVVEELRWTEARWQQYLVEFEAAVVEINRRIDTYNLTVPLVRFQMFRLRVDDELQRIIRVDKE